MKYFELTTDHSVRPSHPEDNTLLIKASDMATAIETYRLLVYHGHLNSKGDVKECREVYYVIDTLPESVGKELAKQSK